MHCLSKFAASRRFHVSALPPLVIVEFLLGVHLHSADITGVDNVDEIPVLRLYVRPETALVLAGVDSAALSASPATGAVV